MSIYDFALKQHVEWKGKIEVTSKSKLSNKEELSLAYTPGVAQPCIEIAKSPEAVYDYTWKGNSVAVVTDGTAVLGLGNIGPEAALPVMEGKCALFKVFADIDAVPICLDTTDPKEIISIIKAIAPGFGGINLEDISAPRCVEIERTLIKELNIPVFHDDQHGTAIVVLAALLNACKLVNKEFENLNVVISGTGAAGSSIIKLLHSVGVINITAFNVNGILVKEDFIHYNSLEKELCEIVNTKNLRISMQEALVGADVFIGVSAPKLLSVEAVKKMAKDAIVFALANPEPEISYEDAKIANARVVCTGRSDFPNQVNNVLVFPGLFKGALKSRSKTISEAMKIAAAHALASLIRADELSEDNIIPSVFDSRVATTIADAVAMVALLHD